MPACFRSRSKASCANFNPDKDIQSWARWIVGIDFGYGHPFAAALCAWVPEVEDFYVVDGFKMERGEAFYHVKRMAGMCRGLRIPIAWPHDGLQHEKGSGVAARRCLPPSRRADARRRTRRTRPAGYHTEPAIEEMCGYMKRGAIHDRSPHERTCRGVSAVTTATRTTRSSGCATT